jgi:RNA polymerase sigma-70 factor, ECF subfamily
VPHRTRTLRRLLDPEAAADHLPRLYRLAWSLSGSRHIAEEVTQETYARVLSRPRRLRASDEFGYLASTLRNVLSDHWRAERRRPPQVTDAPLVDLPHPGGGPEDAVRAGEVYTAVAALPEPFRDIVAAVDLAGMSYAEAADALEIPVGTVMSRLYRARSRLAGALADSA